MKAIRYTKSSENIFAKYSPLHVYIRLFPESDFWPPTFVAIKSLSENFPDISRVISRRNRCKSCTGRWDQFHSRTEKNLLVNFLWRFLFLQPDCTFEWYHAASSSQRHNRRVSLCDTCHLVSVRHIRRLKIMLIEFTCSISTPNDLRYPFSVLQVNFS